MQLKHIVLVEDDRVFARTLARSFERRGYRVSQAESLHSLTGLLANATPDYAVVDLKLQGESGLACVDALHRHDGRTAIVVLTGFASIATAVEAIKLGTDYPEAQAEAIKLGASQYLTKPASTDDIEAAFARQEGDKDTPLSTRQTSIKNLEWEHIHQALIESDFNISEAARRLGMHRRTLARKLEKQRLK